MAKNRILNKMLLEEKESVRLMEKSHKLEIEKVRQEGQMGKEAQMLVVDANEKLQMVSIFFQRPQKTLTLFVNIYFITLGSVS